MKCSVCGKEFGTGNNCQFCGVDKFIGLGNYNGYSAPVGNNISFASPSSNSGKLNQKTIIEPNTTIADSMVCYSCGEIIPSDSKFCPYCSKELYVTCPKCGHKYSSQFPACNQCGTNRVKFYEMTAEEKKKLKEYLDNLSATVREIK